MPVTYQCRASTVSSIAVFPLARIISAEAKGPYIVLYLGCGCLSETRIQLNGVSKEKMASLSFFAAEIETASGHAEDP